MARWSRGMILALGARGPGLKSRTSPVFFQNSITLKNYQRSTVVIQFLSHRKEFNTILQDC